MLGTGVSWWRVARVGVWCLLGLSVSTWLLKWAGYVPNPERMKSSYWDALSWSWPLCLLVLKWQWPPRKRDVVLAVMGPLLVACGLFGSMYLGEPHTLHRIQLPTVAGRSVRLALLRSAEWFQVCDEVVVLLSRGWVLQTLGVRACSGHERMESLDPDGFEIKPGPAKSTFIVFGKRTVGDSGAQNFRLGVFRIGLGGQLVRVVGGDEPR